MLTAAVCGNFFSSPSVEAIYECIKACTEKNAPGCLLVVKNYTGDILNFSLAKEMAIQDGLNVKMVIIGDDVALMNQNKEVGRRGLAGTVFIHKIAGAMSEKGKNLNDIYETLKEVEKKLFTIGLALGSCIVPGNTSANFSLEADEFEIGLGIHGEKGFKKMKMMDASEIVKMCMNILITNSGISKGDKICLMINNLGSITNPELYICANEVLKYFENKEVIIEKIYLGTFMTALEMPGVSFTIMNTSKLNIFEYLDAVTRCNSWHYNDFYIANRDYTYKLNKNHNEISKIKLDGLNDEQKKSNEFNAKLFSEMANSLIKSEELLSNLDSITGDGDFGLNMSKLGKMILDSIQKNEVNLYDIKETTHHFSLIVQKIGGTSGAVFGIFLLKFSNYLKNLNKKDTSYSLEEILNAFKSGINGVSNISGAKSGDRTFLDSLIPAIEIFENEIKNMNSSSYKNILNASIEGAEKTKNMFPKKGRSSYLGERVIGFEDPGAKCISLLFNVWYEQIIN